MLDLYQGYWQDERLDPFDRVISSDEKTSIQARIRMPRDARAGAGAAPPRGARVRARRGVAIPGGLGRAARAGHGPLRSQDGDRAVRAAGRAGDGAPRIPHAVWAERRAKPGVLGGGQRLVAPGRGVGEAG